jgi:hypothetical protein
MATYEALRTLYGSGIRPAELIALSADHIALPCNTLDRD